MILDAVIIILSEVLEAAFLISLLVASWHSRQLFSQQVWLSIILGVTFAFIVALNLGAISDWQDGLGQELFNAALISLLIITLVIHGFLMLNKSQGKLIPLLGKLIVILAIAREGSEILVFSMGFTSTPELFVPVLLGGVVGLGIGVSAGVLCYFMLTQMQNKWASNISYCLLGMIAAGLSVELILNLMQADIVEYAGAFWNTDSILKEASILGQLLYATFGYESTPTLVQIAVYFSLISLFAVMFFYRCFFKKSSIKKS